MEPTKGVDMGDNPILAGWQLPTRPDATTIELLQRRQDGSWVSFARDNRVVGGKWEEPFSLPADGLNTLFGDVELVLREFGFDGFHSVHGMEHPPNKPSKYYPGFHVAKRAADRVAFLTAAFADLDCYQNNVEQWEVYAGLEVLAGTNQIPEPSFVLDSGRGVWVYWIIADSDARNKPLPATDQNKRLWCAVQRAILERFEDWAPDPKSMLNKHGLSRVMPVAGTIRRKLDPPKRTSFRIWGSGRMVNHYTIETLAEWFGLDPLAEFPSYEIGKAGTGQKALPASVVLTSPWGERKGDARSQRAATGQEAALQRNLSNLYTLWAIRGGFTKGTRTYAGAILARSLVRLKRVLDPNGNRVLFSAGLTRRQYIADRMAIFGESCEPKMNDQEIKAAIRMGKALTRQSYSTIADRLQITPEERALLTKWPAAGETSGPIPRPTKKRDATARRRDAIKALLAATGGIIPRLAEIKLHLDGLRIPSCAETIRRDLKKLGASNPRAHRKKPKAGALFQPEPDA